MISYTLLCVYWTIIWYSIHCLASLLSLKVVLFCDILIIRHSESFQTHAHSVIVRTNHNVKVTCESVTTCVKLVYNSFCGQWYYALGENSKKFQSATGSSCLLVTFSCLIRVKHVSWISSNSQPFDYWSWHLWELFHGFCYNTLPVFCLHVCLIWVMVHSSIYIGLNKY